MRRRDVLAATAGAAGALLLAAGIIYLSTACENLPGILGPTPGDTSPRTPLGIVGVVLGLIALLGALVVARRRARPGP